jgi:hypothetical protein
VDTLEAGGWTVTIKHGQVRLSYINAWHVDEHHAVFDVDCHTKYAQSAGGGGMDKEGSYLGLVLFADENPLRASQDTLPTEINFRHRTIEPSQWGMIYDGGRYSWFVVLYRWPPIKEKAVARIVFPKPPIHRSKQEMCDQDGEDQKGSEVGRRDPQLILGDDDERR